MTRRESTHQPTYIHTRIVNTQLLLSCLHNSLAPKLKQSDNVQNYAVHFEIRITVLSYHLDENIQEDINVTNN